MGDKETPVKEEPVVDSPTSVLEEEVCFFVFVCV